MAIEQGNLSRRTDTNKRGLTGNIIVGIVAALAAGLITFTITHQHDLQAESRALAARNAQVVRQHLTQQAQAAGQLEKAATTLYRSTSTVYAYQVTCAARGNTWPVCAALFPHLASFSATTATFDTDRFTLADPTATRLTTQFAHGSIETVEASSPAQAKTAWTATVTAYLALAKRCDQLIRG
jgi:hypothetical protein